MDGSACRDAVASIEALAVLGIVGLVVGLAVLIALPLRSAARREDDVMQQPFGDQPWWPL